MLSAGYQVLVKGKLNLLSCSVFGTYGIAAGTVNRASGTMGSQPTTLLDSKRHPV
jgi:hypothetical protein